MRRSVAASMQIAARIAHRGGAAGKVGVAPIGRFFAERLQLFVAARFDLGRGRRVRAAGAAPAGCTSKTGSRSRSASDPSSRPRPSKRSPFRFRPASARACRPCRTAPGFRSPSNCCSDPARFRPASQGERTFSSSEFQYSSSVWTGAWASRANPTATFRRRSTACAGPARRHARKSRATGKSCPEPLSSRSAISRTFE